MLEVVQQRWPGECGACCVVMIARGHGLTVSRDDLDQFVDIGPSGLSAAQLVHLLTTLGVRAAGVAVSGPLMQPAHLPCIVHWKPHHFVVLESLSADTVTIVDPRSGRHLLSHTDFARSVGPVAIVTRGVVPGTALASAVLSVTG